MAEKLSVRVVLEMAERVLAPLKRIQSGSSDAANALKAASDKLKELNKAERDVAGYRQTRVALRQQTAQLQAVQAKSTQYSAALEEQRTRHINITASLRSAKHAYNQITNAYQDGKIQGAEYTRQIELARITLLSSQQAHEKSLASINKYKAQVKNAGERVAGLTQSIKGGTERLAGYKTRLDAAGIDTARLGVQSRTLKGNIEASTASIERQKEALRALGEQQKKLAALKEKHAKAMLHTGMAAGAGMAMQAAGRRGVEIGMGPVRNYSQHEDAMLGIARQVPGARNEMGQLTEVYRQAERDVRALSGQIPLATTEITNMMTAAARMEVPTDQLKEFTLMASEMATAFDAVPDEITESMGKVAKNFKIALTDIRGLADSINYLDDNAISKGADIIDFLNRTSGVVSTVAMSARDAAALGSTLLTLGERTETASTAANAIVQKFAAATKGTKNFKSAMEEIGLSTEAVQKGMSQDATATLDKVIAAIGKLPEDKRIGVMVELVGMEHSDTLAKLVDKPEELARQRALANGSEAKGSMAREAAARNAALSAQWQMTKNRAFDLGAVVGESLAPALLQLMKAVNPLIDGFSRWVQAHPVLVGWVMKLVIGGAALVAALGAVLVPLALIAGKAMLVRFLFARLALMFAGTGAATGAVAGGMGILYRLGFMLGRAFALLRSAASFLLVGLRALAVFLIANPIVAAFALLATAAYMVWRNWDGIKGGLLAIWQQLSGAVGAWWSSTTAGAAQLWQDLVALKARFFSAGADLMEGLMGGITSRLAAVRDAVVGAADAVGAWFREKLGIASPSKVFMQYGGWISEGAALGIAGGQGAVRTAALAMAAAAGGAIPLAGNAAAMKFDTRPPMTLAAPGAQAGARGGATYHITVNAAPGMDERALARAVAQELDRRERQAGVRARSAMRDD